MKGEFKLTEWQGRNKTWKKWENWYFSAQLTPQKYLHMNNNEMN